MKVGVVGLGRMGEGMSRRIKSAGIEVVGYRRNYDKCLEAKASGYITDAAKTIKDLVQQLRTDGEPSIYLMVVPAENVEATITELIDAGAGKGDIIIDHGNSNFKDSRRRALHLEYRGITYLDCGTSGGVYGLKRGYCLMVGGEAEAVELCSPIFSALAPGIDAAPRTLPGSDVTPAENGWLHCGSAGAGHLVKCIHNGIEYGQMAALAEGLNILQKANLGTTYVSQGDAEVAPMDNPMDYCYDLDIPEIVEVWRRGSVVSSWLLDLTAESMRQDNELDAFAGGVSDSGEGRWTVKAAVDLGVPAPTITASLFSRFESRRLGNYANRVLNAMRAMFGGHAVRKD